MWKAAGFPPKRDFHLSLEQGNKNRQANQQMPMMNQNFNNGGGGWQPYAGMANQFGNNGNNGGNGHGFGGYMGRNY